MSFMELPPLEQCLIERKIVPVAVIESLEDAVPLASTLAESGLPLIEVTLRTPCALDSIRAIRSSCPDVLVGAGTVLNQSQAISALEAGAHFGVSPGLNEKVVRAALDRKWPFMPGVMTPSEVEHALELGCRLQKLFPVDAAGGVKLVKSLSGPYSHAGVRFVPLGGVSVANMRDYLDFPIVAAVGGSWLCELGLIREKNWKEIQRLAREAVAHATAESLHASNC